MRILFCRGCIYLVICVSIEESFSQLGSESGVCACVCTSVSKCYLVVVQVFPEVTNFPEKASVM